MHCNMTSDHFSSPSRSHAKSRLFAEDVDVTGIQFTLASNRSVQSMCNASIKAAHTRAMGQIRQSFRCKTWLSAHRQGHMTGKTLEAAFSGHCDGQGFQRVPLWPTCRALTPATSASLSPSLREALRMAWTPGSAPIPSDSPARSCSQSSTLIAAHQSHTLLQRSCGQLGCVKSSRSNVTH